MYVYETVISTCSECKALTITEYIRQKGTEWSLYKAERTDCDCGYVYIRLLDNSFEQAPGKTAILKGKRTRTELTIEQELEFFGYFSFRWHSVCSVTEEQLSKLSEEMLEVIEKIGIQKFV